MLGLAVFLVEWQVGSLNFVDEDEAAYAKTAQEMVTSGNWIYPRCNYNDFTGCGSPGSAGKRPHRHPYKHRKGDALNNCIPQARPLLFPYTGRYILPVFPPLAVLTAGFFEEKEGSRLPQFLFSAILAPFIIGAVI